MTPLRTTIKRSLIIDGTEYVITLTPEALKLTRKGKRLGIELKWSDITSGESALAVALRASLGRLEPDSKPAGRNAPMASKKATRTGAPTRKLKGVLRR